MQAFKTYFKIAGKHMFSIIVYVAISLFIMVAQSDVSADYAETRLRIAVRDLDGSAASSRLFEYIGENHEIKEVDFDDNDMLLDNLYYRQVQYIITVNEGFSEGLAAGKTEGLFTVSKIDDSFASQLFESQLQGIVTSAEALTAAGTDPESAMQRAVEAASEGIDVESVAEQTPDSQKSYVYFTLFGYTSVAILVVAIGIVLAVMLDSRVVYRTFASSYSPTRYIVSVFAASGVFAVATWLLLMGVTAVKTDGVLFTASTTPKALINSILYLIISTEIAVLVAFVSKSVMTAHIAGNVIGMGMAFLCGVFVPMDLLGDKVIAFSRFLPAFWYEYANDMIFSMGDVPYSSVKFAQCLAMEGLFIVLLFSAILLVSRSKQSRKEV